MIRTSVTIDEAVGILMGWVNGPVLFQSVSEDPTQEELEELDSAEFLVSDALEERLRRFEKNLEKALREGSASDLAEMQAAIANHKQVDLKARAYYCAVNDEINRGEQSSLRVDTARSNAYCTYITQTSLNEWATHRFGISILASIDKSTTSVQELQAQPAAARVKLRDQEKVILEQIGIQGHDPKALPPHVPGKAGVKKAVRVALAKSPLFAATKSFDKAWERLRDEESIKDTL